MSWWQNQSTRLMAGLLGVGVSALIACVSSASASIGVVARMDPHDGRVIVVEVPPGLAGARAGLEVGDQIVEVDQLPVQGMSRESFQRAVRGDVGSVVTLTVIRSGARQHVRVERMALKRPPSSAR